MSASRVSRQLGSEQFYFRKARDPTGTPEMRVCSAMACVIQGDSFFHGYALPQIVEEV
jgi:hypothetical protein